MVLSPPGDGEDVSLSADDDVVSLTLSSVAVFAGVGGEFDDADGDSANGALTIEERYSDDVVSHGAAAIGFFGEVSSMDLIAIQAAGADYLGLSLSGLSADLIGFDPLLVFHAWGVELQLNTVSGSAEKLDWDSLSISSGLDLSGSAVLGIDESVDLHASGSVAFDALSGTVVGTGGFTLDLGQVSGPDITDNSDAIALAITGADLFAGVGGSLSTPAVADDWSTATVVNGTLGFRAATNSMTLITIMDPGADPIDAADDTNYVGAAIEGMSGALIGLDDIPAIADFVLSDLGMALRKSA